MASLPKKSQAASRFRPFLRFRPAWVAVAFIVTFAGLSWFAWQSSRSGHRRALELEVAATARALEARLAGTSEYLRLLAFEHAAGELTQEMFQVRTIPYLEDHPELISIMWVGPDYVITDVAPRERNRHILGLSVALPESAHASRLASRSAQATYTGVFEAIQGRASFEAWVPAFDQQRLLGLFSAVYSCDGVVQHVLAPSAGAGYGIELLDGTHRTVARRQLSGVSTASEQHRIELSASGPELLVRLWLTRDSALFLGLASLVLVCAGLGICMARAIVIQRSEIAQRTRAEDALRASEAQLQADIAERQRGELRRTVMGDELDHRVKNNLAAVLSLARQTIHSSGTLAIFEETFTGRILAMARNHEGLAATGWIGSDLGAVVDRMFAMVDPQRRHVEGEHVLLPARVSGPLTSALHELLTNATKHGALAGSAGQVTVTWRRRSDGSLQLNWSEHCAADIVAPATSGLGLRLMRGFIEGELGGDVTHHFLPTGVVCELVIRLRDLGGAVSPGFTSELDNAARN